MCILTKPSAVLQVRTSWGLQRTNRELTEGLSLAVASRLRWGGRPEDSATLAVMLLKVGRLLGGVDSSTQSHCSPR